MNSLEIALIVIGIIIILISCILVDKSQKTTNIKTDRIHPNEISITEEAQQQMKVKMEELFEQVSEDLIIRTDDTLSKISNEKIIAVNEFSDQILEKINRNHEEVVFLYNMLNDKEKELKSAVKEIDTSKKKVQDIMDTKAKSDKVAKAPGEAKAVPPTRNATQADKLERPAKTPPVAPVPQDISTINTMGSNNNSQILTLYSQGKSVMEISKLLDLGQGEVKLVIDLFRGKV